MFILHQKLPRSYKTFPLNIYISHNAQENNLIVINNAIFMYKVTHIELLQTQYNSDLQHNGL